MAGTLRLSNTGTGNGQSTITTAASGDTTYTLPSGGGTFVTTSSTQALTVPFASGTASAPSVTFLGDSNTGIYSPGADQVAVATNGTGRLFVNSAGLVSIGSGTPDVVSLLTINAPANTRYGIGINSTAATGGNFYATRYLQEGTHIGSIFYTTSTSELIRHAALNGIAFHTGSAAAGAERLRITSAGLVGIGTSSPQDTLTVDTSIGVYRASSDPTLSFSVGGTVSAPTKKYRLLIDDSDSDKFQLRDDVTPRVTVDGSGNVGIGTTSPAAKLHVVTSGAGDIRHADGTRAVSMGSTGTVSYIGCITPGQDFALYAGNGEKARIDSSGRLLVGTSTSTNVGSSVPAIQQIRYSSSNVGLSITRDENASNIVLARTSSAPYGLVSNNDTLGQIRWAAGDGTDIESYAAEISCQIDGTPGANDMPGRLVFSTTADGAASPTERLRITSAGNVGIGVTGPSEKLDVNGAVRVTNESAGWGSGAEGGFIDYYSPASQVRFGHLNGASGSAKNVVCYTGGSEAFRVDSNRRLLVGTSSARTDFFGSTGLNALLNVEGTNSATRSTSLVHNSNDASQHLLVLGKSRGTSANSNTIVQNDDRLGTVSFHGADGSKLVEAGRVEAQVDGTPGANDMPGRLVFSTTADGASSPTERMRIKQNGEIGTFSGSAYPLVVRSSNAAGTTNKLFTGTYSATNTTDGTVSFQVLTNGNVQNTNNIYGAISDLKLKENIVNASSQWDDLKALQVRNYNFKEGQTHTQIGLVAQEVELVSPGLVSESPDRDEDGNDLGTVTKTVNYSVLYMKAVKALQEAMERIEQPWRPN
jgi:hypothetical protein